MVYHDDNFGTYEVRHPEDMEFFRETQRESVQKRCRGCGRTVSIRPQYAYCNRCADRIEQGLELEEFEEEEETE